MSASHMNPEEAVTAWEDLARAGAFLPSNWGTFRLTFEDPLERPVRLRAAWGGRGLAEDLLHVLRHGETVTLRPDGRRWSKDPRHDAGTTFSPAPAPLH